MYIRTKYEIVKVETIADIQTKVIFKDNFVAQSETIEELCDEYVIPRYQDTFIVDRFSKQICLNHIKCGYGDVYGAIWTSKGLIYVAKMDSDGKLELI